MTPKDRVLCALDFEKPDRVPRFDSFWTEFVEQWRKAKGFDEATDINDYYKMDIAICVANEAPFPSEAAEVERGSDYLVSRDAWGRVVRTVPGGKFSEVLDVAIKEKSDLDRLPFEPVEVDARYTEFLKHVADERARRCVFCKTGGPYLRTSLLRGTAQFLMDIASDEAFVKELTSKVTDHLIGVGLESLRRANLYDTGLWIYDDIAYNDGPMMSPDSFERIFYPLFKRMVQAFKSAGARKVCLHSDGNILPVLDMLMDAGVEGINPVEPKAGMDLVRLHEQYEGRLALLGGMCNAFVLPGSSTKRIEEETRRILGAGKNGGVVIGAHSIGPDVSVENYDLYQRIVERYGG